jgi:hypothetical protein
MKEACDNAQERKPAAVERLNTSACMEATERSYGRRKR